MRYRKYRIRIWFEGAESMKEFDVVAISFEAALMDILEAHGTTEFVCYNYSLME